ncbi:MAG: phosphatase PAP2 family protein [Vicinamibacterales bacterium]
MPPRALWRRLRKFERRELLTLLAGLAICLLLWGFLALASEVMEGDTTALDGRILLALRSADDPARPIGPVWIEPALLDLTAIGSTTVLGLVVFAVSGFLALQQRYRTALFILLTAVSGEAANWIIKGLFARPRPTIVPHLQAVVSSSFPSGHAMESALIYLTLGAMLMRTTNGRVTKIYCMSLAVLLTLLVGISRVYLGVHYPTDVVGGWMFGFLWASVWWVIERRFEQSTGVSDEKPPRTES